MTADRLKTWAENNGIKVSTLKVKPKGPAVTPTTNPSKKAKRSKKTMATKSAPKKKDKTLKAKKVERSATTPVVETLTPIAVKATPVVATVKVGGSLLDRIRQASKKSDEVVHNIQEAKEVLASDDAIEAFVNAANSADDLFELKATPLAETLLALTQQLQTWEEAGDTTASGILATIQAFQSSAVSIADRLWDVVVNFVRPAAEVQIYAHLWDVLDTLVKAGLVNRLNNQPQTPSEVPIVLGSGEKKAWYLPTDHSVLGKTSWKYILQAEDRAKEAAKDFRISKIHEAQEIVNLTPDAARSGKQGQLFFKFPGENRGVILKVCTWRDRQTQIVGTNVRIIKAFGVKGVSFTEYMDWNSPEDAWPSAEIYRAYTAWKNN